MKYLTLYCFLLTAGPSLCTGKPSADLPGKNPPEARQASPRPTSESVWIRRDETGLAAVLPAPIHGEEVLEGSVLRVVLDPPELRPQDRWFPVRVEIPTGFRDSFQLRVGVRDALGDGEGMRSGNLTASEREILWLDLREPGWKRAEVEVVLLDGDEVVDRVVAQVPVRGPELALEVGQKIPLRIDFPEGDTPPVWPVRFGIPFAPGQLWDAGRLTLENAAGQPVPAQFSVSGRWVPEGSIQWVQAEAEIPSGAGRELFAVVRTGKSATEPASPVRLREEGDRLVVETGAAEFVFGKSGEPLREIRAAGQTSAAAEGARGLYVIDQNGRTGTSTRALEWAFEQTGPLAASLKLEGDYTTNDGARLARFVVRMEFFSGMSQAQFTHTLVLTENSNEVWFREIGWEFTVSGADSAATAYVAAGTVVEKSLASGTGLVLVQKSVKGLSGRQDRFELLEVADGREAALADGTRMGDWGALAGANGSGLFLSVRDAALQAPKAFVLGQGRLRLELFSPRGGAELDFRAPALLARWNLPAWKPLEKPAMNSIAGYTSNAVGWAKTHQGLISPVVSGQGGVQLAAWSAMDSGRVYVHVDPAWVRATGALGPLHPLDKDQFPENEAFIEETLGKFVKAVPGSFYTGFVDYYAGPHYGHEGRYRLTYTLFRDAWLNYARTGDRSYRRFAEGASRAFRDNYIAHWDGAGKKKGLFIGATPGDSSEGELKPDLPMYWERQAVFNMTTSANLNTLIWDYQIGGDRRSKDVAADVGEAFKKHWTPERRDWRIFMTLRTLLQLHGFTGDPEFRRLLEAGASSSAYDPEGALLLTNDRPYKSTTYKTNSDVGNMIEIEEALGTARWREMARRTARFWFLNLLGQSPLQRISGEYLPFLAAENPADAPAIAQLLDYNLRLSAGRGGPVGFSTLDSVLQGAPYSMSLVASSGVRSAPLASLLEFDDYGEPARIFVAKRDAKPVRLWINSPRRTDGGTLLEPPLKISSWDQETIMGMDLISLNALSASQGAVEIVIPADAAQGVYCIEPTTRGGHFVLADSNVPLVFAPSGPWRPSTFEPSYRYFIQVPEKGAEPARIFFEAPARLFRPDGTVEKESVSGWVDLPRTTPGLWSFEPLKTGLISTEGIPGPIAMNNPKAWFDPGSPAAGEALEETPPPDGDAPSPVVGRLVVAGQALEIPIPESAELAGGEVDGRACAGSGTIEFFMQPRWGTFDLGAARRILKPVLDVETKPGNWSLVYRLDPEGATGRVAPKEPSHSFMASVPVLRSGPGRAPQPLTPWNTRRILEAGEWVHVALVWGLDTRAAVKGVVSVPFVSIYINGRGATNKALPGRQADRLAGVPQVLRFPAAMDAGVAWVRVSKGARYRGNFTPPPVSEGLREDSSTLLLEPLVQTP
jgi:hypothetical protein